MVIRKHCDIIQLTELLDELSESDQYMFMISFYLLGNKDQTGSRYNRTVFRDY